MNSKLISQYVENHKEEAINFLVEAIQIPSVTGDELAISNFFKERIEKIGIPVSMYALDSNRPNLIASWKGENGPCFIFNGHYDVFPPIKDNPGIYGPWSGKIKDGYIYGRGSVDMKSGLCAAVLAAEFLKNMGFEPQGEIIISCDSDEEDGGKYGVEYLLDQGLLNGDFGVCMEPTKSKVQVEGGGGIFLKVTYNSETWHGGVQKDITDALEKAVRAVQKLYELDKKLRKERYYEPFHGGAFLSITEMSAGEAMNVHPASCTFTIDRRIIPGETPQQAEQEIREVLNQLKDSYTDMDYEMELLSRMPALKVEVNNPLIDAALEAYIDVHHKETELYRRPGGSDSAKIVEKYGLCMPNFGPGLDIEETTSPNEHLLIQEYIDFIKIYMLMVVKLLSSN